jgi:hypothetical protein
MNNYRVNLQRPDTSGDEGHKPIEASLDQRSTNACLSAIVLASVFIAVGCNLGKETRYLSSGIDRATQDQVREQLGPPVEVSINKDGIAVWMYQIRESVLEGKDAFEAKAAPRCEDYTLTFDGQGILRHWTHESKRCN